MRKKRLFLLLFTLFFIFISKANAEYRCYYDEKTYISDPDSGQSALNFISQYGGAWSDCNGTVLDLNHTYVELYYTDSGHATLNFYDLTNNKKVKEICFASSSINTSYKISEQSGNELTSADFANGCPSRLHRIAVNDITSPKLLIDNFKPNSYYYTQLFQTPLIDSIWYSWPISQNNNSYCLSTSNSSSTTEVTDNTNPNSALCSYVSLVTRNKEPDLPIIENGIRNSDGTITGLVDDNTITCSYYRATDNDETENVVLKFNKNDGTSIYAYSSLMSGGTDTASVDFNLEAGPRGNYICPDKVYSYDTTYYSFHKYPDVSSGNNTTFLLKHTLSKKQNSNEVGCDNFGKAGEIIEAAYRLIRYLIPILIVILSTADFVGVVFSGEQEKLDKAKKKFIMRLIIGVVALLIPFFLEMVLRLAGILSSGDTLASAVCNWIG